jgi:outer membrane protein assembly factor BamB
MFRVFGGADDVVLIGTAEPAGRNRIVGLRPADGSLAWSFDDAGGDGIGAVEESCAVDYARQQVYFTSRPAAAGTDTVWALSVAEGSATKAWSVGITGAATAPVVNGRAIYLGTAAGEVHAIDADDGGPLWAAPYATGDGPVKDFVFPQRATGRLAFSTAGRTHLVHDDGTAASPVWTSPVALRDPNVPLILDDEVLVADAEGRVLSLDATTSEPAIVVFARFGDGTLPAAPGLPYFDARTGLYLVGTTQGVLHAVQRR